MRIAIGTYKYSRIRLKCTKDADVADADAAILNRIERAAADTSNPLASGSRWVSRRLHRYWPYGFDCTIVSEEGMRDLYQYMMMRQHGERYSIMRDVFKQLIHAVAFLHSADITHNDITPKSRMQIMLVNYDHVTPIAYRMASSRDVVRMPPPAGTIGYDSPESFALRTIDLRARDIWAIGMTVYTCFMGFPLYGYVKVNHGTWQMLREEYEEELASLYRAHRGTNEHALVESDAWEWLDATGFMAVDTLMLDPRFRPTLAQLIEANPL
ncbi:kinase-like domain-containing protein [Syncephalis pseudoplumigaleata]|uniref:Kinase-like domain-containing protein n=1 Tax=Syncephalis pseudoplumigaleata TaxID=1712513 RepID=A0A4P9Z649_9FUNG|nr:kinase-like domain-containing protein [Syncephalis pseudoplumigaleata]|eukprot:RKP28124.1 kinase-like domain-containing protein [Syncephalis pseudoplumigaleata]